MAERAHPDFPGFADEWVRLWGVIPWRKRAPNNPYRQALDWRYQWVTAQAKGLDVLDIPCGMGWGTSMIRGARSLAGIDCAPDAIAEAKQRYGKRIRFAVGDMGRLDFPDGSFDLVSCLEGIEHVPVEVGAKFIDEAHRVLRPQGKLMVSSPHCKTMPHSGNPYHIHEYQPDEIKALIGRKFVLEEAVVREVDVMVVHYLRARRAD